MATTVGRIQIIGKRSATHTGPIGFANLITRLVRACARARAMSPYARERCSQRPRGGDRMADHPVEEVAEGVVAGDVRLGVAVDVGGPGEQFVAAGGRTPVQLPALPGAGR